MIHNCCATRLLGCCCAPVLTYDHIRSAPVLAAPCHRAARDVVNHAPSGSRRKSRTTHETCDEGIRMARNQSATRPHTSWGGSLTGSSFPPTSSSTAWRKDRGRKVVSLRREDHRWLGDNDALAHCSVVAVTVFVILTA